MRACNMGNYPASGLSKLEHAHFTINENLPEFEPASKMSSEDPLYMKPLLKPCIVHRNNQFKSGKLHHRKRGSQRPAPTSPYANLKVVKKVRFADEVMVILTSDRAMEPLVPAHARDNEAVHKKEHESRGCIHPPTTIQSNQSSILRVKMVISKRELSKLLQSREMQSGDCSSMESLLAPFLPPHSSLLNKPSRSFSEPNSNFLEAA